MLKITVEEKRARAGRQVRLILDGKLTGPSVEELEKTSNRVNQEPTGDVSVDLRGVDFISQAGEGLLRQLEREGAKRIQDSQLTRAWGAEMRHVALSLALLALVSGGAIYGQQLSLIGHPPPLAEPNLTLAGSAPAEAFGRYLASIQERNPFTESGPVEVQIEASLPGLAKQGTMRAVRQAGDSERSEYSEIRLDGDSTVKHEVIGRYLTAQEQAESLPYSSVAVTPANYKFRYVGSMETDGTGVYVFQITPKKKRAGLIKGQIWIDSATGIAVHQTGRLVKRPSIFISRIDVTRDTNQRDGIPTTRVTHVAVDTRLVGRAELTITERPLQTADRQAAQILVSQAAAR
jgi:hypothetical protein